MQSPGETGWSEALYACSWLEERMRFARDRAAEVAAEPRKRAVHDVRVACRRLREAIAFFHQSGVPALSDVDRAARRLARAVGPLRVADVARDRLATLDLGESPARAELIALLAAARARRTRKKRERIAKRARTLARAIGERLPMTPPASGAVKGTVGEAELRIALVGRVDQREREVERLWGALVAAPQGAATSDQLHAIRIAIKHWRYATEIARAVMPRDEYQTIAAKLRRLQAAGGKSQDWADVSRAVADIYGARKLTAGERALATATRAAHARAARAFTRALSRDLAQAT